MTASAYHFFHEMYRRRQSLRQVKGFNFDQHGTWPDALISSSGSQGKFPDIILRVNDEKGCPFRGGEMIEIKESQSYGMPSFNSTMPSAVKDIREVAPPGGKLHQAMCHSEGKDPYRLREREVYYLLHGKKDRKGKADKRGACVKVCLVHGAFFDTLPLTENIRAMFAAVVKDALHDNPDAQSDPAFKQAGEKLMRLNWKQSYFNKTREVENSSIKMRLRLMAEVHQKANLLNAKHYPQIADDTLNMIVPADARQGGLTPLQLIKTVFGGKTLPPQMQVLSLQDCLGREFVVFQVGVT